MRNVPIHLLNSFVVFNGSSNINDAAKELGITQPALSKQLILLETYFSQKLFMTTGRKKVLTQFGQYLHQQLDSRIGNIQDVLTEAIHLHGQPELATVRIAARRGILDRLSAVKEFKGSIYFRELSNDEVIRSLLDLKTEIGIVHEAPNTFDLTLKPLFKEQFQIVVPKKMLTRKISFSSKLFTELSGKPALGYGPEDKILQEVCSSQKIDFRKCEIIRATENYQSLSEMVSLGLGWCILPVYIGANESKNWIIPIPESVFPSKQFYLCYRPQFSESPWFKKLLEEIRGCFFQS